MPLISFACLGKVTADSLPAGNEINLLFSKISVPILLDKALTKVRSRRNAYCVNNIGSLPLATLDLWWVLCPATRPCDLVRDDGVRIKTTVGLPASDISGNVRSVEVRKCALVTPRGGALLKMYAALFCKGCAASRRRAVLSEIANRHVPISKLYRSIPQQNNRGDPGEGKQLSATKPSAYSPYRVSLPSRGYFSVNSWKVRLLSCSLGAFVGKRK